MDKLKKSTQQYSICQTITFRVKKIFQKSKEYKSKSFLTPSKRSEEVIAIFPAIGKGSNVMGDEYKKITLKIII